MRGGCLTLASRFCICPGAVLPRGLRFLVALRCQSNGFHLSCCHCSTVLPHSEKLKTTLHSRSPTYHWSPPISSDIPTAKITSTLCRANPVSPGHPHDSPALPWPKSCLSPPVADGNLPPHHGRRQGYAPVCHGIPMFWEQKQIYIHICIMVLALCTHRVLPSCSRKAASTTNVSAKQQLTQHACRCPASLRGRLVQSCSRNASLAAAEGQGVVGHHSMCAHIHRPKWYA